MDSREIFAACPSFNHLINQIDYRDFRDVATSRHIVAREHRESRFVDNITSPQQNNNIWRPKSFVGYIIGTSGYFSEI
jgi:hypothetical protein